MSSVTDKLFMLSVSILNVIMLSVIMMNVIRLNVDMLSANMLNIIIIVDLRLVVRSENRNVIMRKTDALMQL